MKTKEFEDCWNCSGDGYYANLHNGNHDRCYTCKGNGKLPKGSREWEKRCKTSEVIITEEECLKSIDTVLKRMKAWEKKNPKLRGHLK